MKPIYLQTQWKRRASSNKSTHAGKTNKVQSVSGRRVCKSELEYQVFSQRSLKPEDEPKRRVVAAELKIASGITQERLRGVKGVKTVKRMHGIICWLRSVSLCNCEVPFEGFVENFYCRKFAKCSEVISICKAAPKQVTKVTQ